MNDEQVLTDSQYRELFADCDNDIRTICSKASMLDGIAAFLEGIPYEVLTRCSGSEIRDTVLSMIKKVRY